jgi:hypothetical protein
MLEIFRLGFVPTVVFVCHADLPGIAVTGDIL